MTLQEKNKELVRQITDEIWNSGHLERIAEFYSPDYVGDYRPYSPLREGHDAIRGMVERSRAVFPDYHEELHELIAEGDKVVARFTISGTQKGQWGAIAPTGKRAEYEEIVILEIKEGKVIRQRGLVDNLNALRQLGVIPTPTS